jgi:hypothetical protein
LEHRYDKPLKNLAAISLGFRHRRYRGLTFTVTDAIHGSSAFLPVDKAVEILRRTWYQGEDKSVDNPVEKRWKTFWETCARTVVFQSEISTATRFL